MELVEGRATVESVDEFVATLGGIGEEHGCAVQAFDARSVVDRAHLRRAVELADRAFERDENVARDRAVEIVLYAAGRRQIDQALALGVSEGEVPVVVVVHAPETDGGTGGDERAAVAAVSELLEPAETLGGYDEERVCSFFDITDAERAATDASLSELVRERVALLTIDK
ncbi:KEOPS complex subunit Cgi121 [Halomarina salina]|uniref:KEOPS complex subunit Cgi121 n=1 Tax=Halomarina salina TaxID=1872699 RepID=A0ABD5RLR9_9EURY|nr:KEOPS complex subunit Cgi121 [Halomarina salina]